MEQLSYAKGNQEILDNIDKISNKIANLAANPSAANKALVELYTSTLAEMRELESKMWKKHIDDSNTQNQSYQDFNAFNSSSFATKISSNVTSSVTPDNIVLSSGLESGNPFKAVYENNITKLSNDVTQYISGLNDIDPDIAAKIQHAKELLELALKELSAPDLSFNDREGILKSIEDHLTKIFNLPENKDILNIFLSKVNDFRKNTTGWGGIVNKGTDWVKKKGKSSLKSGLSMLAMEAPILKILGLNGIASKAIENFSFGKSLGDDKVGTIRSKMRQSISPLPAFNPNDSQTKSLPTSEITQFSSKQDRQQLNVLSQILRSINKSNSYLNILSKSTKNSDLMKKYEKKPSMILDKVDHKKEGGFLSSLLGGASLLGLLKNIPGLIGTALGGLLLLPKLIGGSIGKIFSLISGLFGSTLSKIGELTGLGKIFGNKNPGDIKKVEKPSLLSKTKSISVNAMGKVSDLLGFGVGKEIPTTNGGFNSPEVTKSLPDNKQKESGSALSKIKSFGKRLPVVGALIGALGMSQEIGAASSPDEMKKVVGSNIGGIGGGLAGASAGAALGTMIFPGIGTLIGGALGGIGGGLLGESIGSSAVSSLSRSDDDEKPLYKLLNKQIQLQMDQAASLKSIDKTMSDEELYNDKLQEAQDNAKDLYDNYNSEDQIKGATDSTNIFNSVFSKIKSLVTGKPIDNSYSGMSRGDAKRGMGSSENSTKAMDFFISKGWTKEQAAGIVGNLQAESGKGLDKTAVGDNGKAYGIAQWHPDRQAKFKEVFGKDIRVSTEEEQLAFVDWELNNTHKNAGDLIKKSTTASQAAAITNAKYEISQDGMNGKHAARASNAEAVAQEYVKKQQENRSVLDKSFGVKTPTDLYDQYTMGSEQERTKIVQAYGGIPQFDGSIKSLNQQTVVNNSTNGGIYPSQASIVNQNNTVQQMSGVQPSVNITELSDASINKLAMALSKIQGSVNVVNAAGSTSTKPTPTTDLSTSSPVGLTAEAKRPIT